MNFGDSKVKIFIYANDHPPPHCHVIINKVETRVILPTLEILSGPKLTKEALDLLLEKLDDLCDTFDHYNPKKHLE
ncbi:DUF4160 domain-containing protein [Pedobacter sp. CFBP9032]|uniref:DUF4160 domain-containing protein n=1 Tax=Pedobacter sp. CFBP9032 TaxID=3096539 RepID=UPI0039C983E6